MLYVKNMTHTEQVAHSNGNTNGHISQGLFKSMLSMLCSHQCYGQLRWRTQGSIEEHPTAVSRVQHYAAPMISNAARQGHMPHMHPFSMNDCAQGISETT